MTPAEADWVYDVVLTQRYKESVGAVMWTGARELRRDEGRGRAFVRTCECFWGPCGWCGDGRPDKCAHRDGRVGAAREPLTSIITAAGYALIDVWTVGRGCKWNCPGPDLRAAVQLTLL